MQPLILEGKDDTPFVNLDKEKAIFEISGKSLPEDVMEFYQPVYDWLENYSEQPNDETCVKMKIEYFKSASISSKSLMALCDAELKDKGPKVIIDWHFLREDEDMLEAGHDYADLTGLEFNYIGYDTNN